MTSSAQPEALLIQIAGSNRPDITTACLNILIRNRAVLLDIGHAVIDDQLTLSILITAAPPADLITLQYAVETRTGMQGLQSRFAKVTTDTIPSIPPAVAPSHFIVTLLATELTTTILARVAEVLTAASFTIDRIERLTTQLAPKSICDFELTNASIQIGISGAPANEASLRQQLLAAAQQFSIDISIQHEAHFRRKRRLIAFDMDSTLIQGEVIDQLARLAGVGEQVSRITESAMRGELDFDQSFTRRLGLLKGLRAEQAHSLLNTIPLAPGAERLFRALKRLNYKTAILSGGFNFFARRLQKKFAIDHIHSNELEIVDGLVTGRVIPPIINGARKAELLAQIAASEGIPLEQTIAVGDGANDIPMLTLAGMGIAYRAKPIVRQQAQHSITTLGLDGILYLLGLSDLDLIS